MPTGKLSGKYSCRLLLAYRPDYSEKEVGEKNVYAHEDRWGGGNRSDRALAAAMCFGTAGRGRII